mgnify:CR=1 FL=1
MAGTRRRHAPLSGAPPPQRAADLARGLGGDDDEDASAVEATAAAWWRRLVSPFDKEIFLLAVPALFRCEGASGGWEAEGSESAGGGGV